uniref:poly(A)-specific ribonuclease n=1 Tax=Leersia perrieri TaxID=77586 RepID=A0A0D9XHF7_9ORYZ
MSSSFLPPPPPMPMPLPYPQLFPQPPPQQAYVTVPAFNPRTPALLLRRCTGAGQLRSLTAANMNAEMQLIGHLMSHYTYISIDVEYAGIVYHPAVASRNLTPDERYALVKANVDEVPIVQLGITLSDSQGNLPMFHDHLGLIHEMAWEVVFSDFDASRGHAHAVNSVKFLESQGIDFDLARLTGVSSTLFGQRLLAILPPSPEELTWSAFGAAYDMAYILKMLTGGQPLPESRQEFIAQTKSRLGGGRIFDSKYMVEHDQNDLRDVGLRQTATRLGVGQQVQMTPMLAGYKTILASRIFSICRLPRGGNDNHHEGHIDGLV